MRSPVSRHASAPDEPLVTLDGEESEAATEVDAMSVKLKVAQVEVGVVVGGFPPATSNLRD